MLSDREACLVLNMISGVGASRLQALIDAFGSPSIALQQSTSALEKVSGIGVALAERLVHWEQYCDLNAEFAMIERSGVKLLTRYDSSYPTVLRQLDDSPICLYVKGQLPENFADSAIAVVGTRRMTRYGREMAQHLSEGIILGGWTIVSGLAVGIDCVAHETAVSLKGRTIAVLGGGLGRIYPQEHVPLARKIIETGGAVVSEFPMMMPPSKRTFPMRNRIVSGISRGTLVVEANLNSGALITANFALEQGKTVFAVPGQIDNPLSRGSHALIKQGARLVENVDDIFEEFSYLPGFNIARAVSAKPQQPLLFDEKIDSAQSLSAEETKILSILRQGDAGIEELTEKSGLATGLLLSVLMKMELKRLIRPQSGGRYGVK